MVKKILLIMCILSLSLFAEESLIKKLAQGSERIYVDLFDTTSFTFYSDGHVSSSLAGVELFLIIVDENDSCIKLVYFTSRSSGVFNITNIEYSSGFYTFDVYNSVRASYDKDNDKWTQISAPIEWELYNSYWDNLKYK